MELKGVLDFESSRVLFQNSRRSRALRTANTLQSWRTKSWRERHDCSGAGRTFRTVLPGSGVELRGAVSSASTATYGLTSATVAPQDHRSLFTSNTLLYVYINKPHPIKYTVQLYRSSCTKSVRSGTSRRIASSASAACAWPPMRTSTRRSGRSSANSPARVLL